MSFKHGPKESAGFCMRGNGEHNLQIVILDADGRMVHAMAGFIDPKAFLKELVFGRDLARRVDGLDDDVGEPLVARAHRRRLRALDGTEGTKGNRSRTSNGANDDDDHDDGSLFDRLRSGGGAADLLGSLTDSRVKSDHRFCRKNPLMDWRDFRTEDMVGNAKTFFGSTTSSSPGGQDVNDLLRRLRGDESNDANDDADDSQRRRRRSKDARPEKQEKERRSRPRRKIL